MAGGSGVGLEGFANQRCGVFTQLTFFRTEGSPDVRVDIEFAGDLAVYENRHNDFGLGLERASKIARIGVRIVDYDCFAGRSGGAANTLVEWNARVRGHGALEGAKNQNVALGIFFEHVETNPMEAREFFMKQRDNAAHQGLDGARSFCQRVEFGNQICEFRLCGSHAR